MKHTWKQAAAWLLCLAMAASLTACGKDKTKKADNTPAAPQNETVKDGQNDGDSTVSIIPFDNSEDETVTTTTTTKGTTTTTNTKKSKTTAAKSTTTAKPAETTKATEAAPQRDNAYKINTKTYTANNGDITFRYPQISGLYDQDIQDFYNKLFQSDCKEAVSDETSPSTLDVSFEVKYKTKDKLSIVFYGSYFYEGAAHPYAYAYCYNIDLATGETFVPSEQISAEKAADAILADKWTLLGPVDDVTKDDIIEYYNSYSEEALKDAITEKDVFTVKRDKNGKFSTTGQTACSSYLDSNGSPVRILFVSHALGDYVEVKLN
jgi:hypothetical protein